MTDIDTAMLLASKITGGEDTERRAILAVLEEK
jgi:hypothetical protein